MNIAGKLVSTAAMVLAFSTPGFSQDEVTKETVLVTVNGTDITVGHVLSLASRIPEEYTRIDDSQLYAGIVDQLVQQQLLSGLIEEETTELRLAAENEHRALYATEAIQRIYEAGLTEDAIKEKYTALYVNAEPIPEFGARHILVKTKDEANEIVTQLEKGADFVELAKEKSTGPSGVTGGDLGWNGIGSLVPEFEAVMVKLEEGQVSAPVKTQFGWHVIKLTGKRDQPVPELDQVRAEIEDAIKAGTLEKRISQLETEGKIERNVDEIDPSIIRKFELLKD